jgi:hypothetical protein
MSSALSACIGSKRRATSNKRSARPASCRANSTPKPEDAPVITAAHESSFTITHHANQKDIVESIKKKFIRDVLIISSAKVKKIKLILEKIS